MKRHVVTHLSTRCSTRCLTWSRPLIRVQAAHTAALSESLQAKSRISDRELIPENPQNGTRERRSRIYVPRINLPRSASSLSATELLTATGYVRQAHAGIFHLLPLGLRVQNKLERLIDKHMNSIEASKVSLSSLSSQDLWDKSGRLSTGSEFFKLNDRNESKYLLAPTHEEEITELVSRDLRDSSSLPLRLYQIGRKYRDEKRPRGGLLRGREFIMKDLYTFDQDQASAHSTYEVVRNAYRNFFNDLKVKWLEARATSGEMGGNLSHEYHFPNTFGEDTLIACTNCGYARNEEFVDQESIPATELRFDSKSPPSTTPPTTTISTHMILSSDRSALVIALAPNQGGNSTISSYAVKDVVQNNVTNLDSGIENPEKLFRDDLASKGKTAQKSIYYVVDSQIDPHAAEALVSQNMRTWSNSDVRIFMISAPTDSGKAINLLRPNQGDPCPECKSGSLTLEKAIEVGHTFHLGSRYSSKLGLTISPPASPQELSKEKQFVEMGCHGIGVSRLIAAVASCLSDDKGLNWPRVIAPYEVIIVGADGKPEKGREENEHVETFSTESAIYDMFAQSKHGPIDVLLDDRPGVTLPFKMKDADLIGYPVMVVVGRGAREGKVEVQCRQLGVKESVEIQNVVQYVSNLLERI